MAFTMDDPMNGQVESPRIFKAVARHSWLIVTLPMVIDKPILYDFHRSTNVMLDLKPLNTFLLRNLTTEDDTWCLFLLVVFDRCKDDHFAQSRNKCLLILSLWLLSL